MVQAGIRAAMTANKDAEAKRGNMVSSFGRGMPCPSAADVPRCFAALSTCRVDEWNRTLTIERIA
jgi:hypothetical protein